MHLVNNDPTDRGGFSNCTLWVRFCHVFLGSRKIDGFVNRRARLRKERLKWVESVELCDNWRLMRTMETHRHPIGYLIKYRSDLSSLERSLAQRKIRKNLSKTNKHFKSLISMPETYNLSNKNFTCGQNCVRYVSIYRKKKIQREKKSWEP